MKIDALRIFANIQGTTTDDLKEFEHNLEFNDFYAHVANLYNIRAIM